MELLAFVTISFGIIIVPGPNVLLIVSTSIANGKMRGLQTVMGTSAAMFIQLLIAALGTTYLVKTLSAAFIWLKWFGVAYLMYLSLTHLIASRKSRKKVTASASFQQGFWVSLTNPKTIIFFSAFLPQFVMASEPYLMQILMLSGLFWLLAILLDSAYALLASRVGAFLEKRNTHTEHHKLSGLMFITAGTTLAVAKLSDN